MHTILPKELNDIIIKYHTSLKINDINNEIKSICNNCKKNCNKVKARCNYCNGIFCNLKYKKVYYLPSYFFGICPLCERINFIQDNPFDINIKLFD